MGGGASGQLSFPDSDNLSSTTGIYSHWVIDDMEPMITAAVAAATPYDSETSPDPNTFMDDDVAGKTQHRMNLHTTIVDAVDDETDFGDFVDRAKEKADAAGIFPDIDVSTDIEAVHVSERGSIDSLLDSAMDAAADSVTNTALAAFVDAYEEMIRKTWLKSVSRFAAGMADINAVNSSAFIFGMALLERQMMDDVDKFSAEQGLNVFNQYVVTFRDTFRAHVQTHMEMNRIRKSSRDTMILRGTAELARMLSVNLDMGLRTAHLQEEVNRIRQAAAVEEHQNQLRIDVEEALWDFSLYQYGANLLASAGGAVMVPSKMGAGQSVLSGAATGAGIGTAASGGIPGPGTLIGAGIGALIGAFS